MSRIAYDDLSGMDAVAFAGKVSGICKELDQAQRKYLAERFQATVLLSEKQACYSVAVLNKWFELAAVFAAEINGMRNRKGLIHA